jgi:endonuclease/exonuclease/phosphatase family metal-dependent hydrolase
MAQFLRDPVVLQAEVIAIQEPWRNLFKDDTHHPEKQTHELVWPQESETGERARVCMYVSKKLSGWTHYVHSRDCHELRIKTRSAGELRIVNVYNEQEKWGALDLLKGVLPPMREQRGFSYLILGDFNLHHPV